jgi:hypothetical protein
MDAAPGELTERALMTRILISTLRMEERMSALSDSLDRLTGAVRDKITALESALADERSAAASTAAAEEAEDVEQNQALADARAATDAAVGELNAAVSQVDSLTQEISGTSGDPSDVSVEPTDTAGTDTAGTGTDAAADTSADTGVPDESGTAAEPTPGPEDETTV